MSPSQRGPLPPHQHLACRGGPLRLRPALGSAQTAPLSGRSPPPPRTPQFANHKLRPSLHALGPPLWDVSRIGAEFTSAVTSLLHFFLRFHEGCYLLADELTCNLTVRSFITIHRRNHTLQSQLILYDSMMYVTTVCEDPQHFHLCRQSFQGLSGTGADCETKHHRMLTAPAGVP